MLSGNGRHRRPRQAPALLVAAGVTGSAIAIPLLGAGAASAADGETWDRVAECESGGSWSQNTGNGYYGGLQLTQDDWEGYGGLEFAPSADQASRNQQITVAERILADQGVGKWRACGLLTGLNQDTASPNVDPGVPTDADREDSRTGGTATPSGSPESSDSSASPSPSATSGSSEKEKGEASTGASPSVSAAPEGDESDKSGQSTGSSAATESEETGPGRHRGPVAQEDEAADDVTPPSGRHASRSVETPAGITDDRYTVQTGDSLTSIADSLALTGGWTALYVENQQVIGEDPDVILPGQRLLVDAETGE
ncbi:transglycosylase family protein [Streptomyces sp. CL7]|uniref:LysM peptidoglycan-binding domain-containing protein n=1 Tax=Streptomyces sp. CL7 TaxID=3096006 RepID=UPI002A753554|nr:transglycosylase family protein [Streptomyces sp. CL7]WPP30313.1 transglycosylase family protein [Streptomyces sp. CL7]